MYLSAAAAAAAALLVCLPAGLCVCCLSQSVGCVLSYAVCLSSQQTDRHLPAYRPTLAAGARPASLPSLSVIALATHTYIES